jgi:uncharacterized lipoprotein YmbA
MTRAVRTLAVIVAVGLIATACASVRTSPEIRYYVLAVTNDNARALPAPVRVDVFSIDDPYATRQLAYRASPYRLAYYNYHRWAGSPEGVVAAAVRDYLEQGGAEVEGAPFEISARVRRLEEVDDDEGWSGALTIDFTVHQAGALVLERAYSETEPAAERNPEAVVAALSRALNTILHTLVGDLADVHANTQ